MLRDRVKELRRVKASDLAANPRNWRTHPGRQESALRSVLAEVGVADALIAYETPAGLVLIDGHLRREVAPDHEWPVLVLDLTEAEADKMLLALDPLAGMAEADPVKLADLMAEIDLESEALTAHLESLLPPELTGPGRGGDEFDAAPEVEGPTRTQAGELWVIGGKHRLLVGDCTLPENLARLFGGEKAALCNTDPPYGVFYSDAVRVAAERASGRQQRGRKWGNCDIENDALDGSKLQAFLESYIRVAVPHLVDNAAWYMWHPMLTQGAFFAAAAAAADILIHRQIVWTKPVLLFGFGDYHWKHELCFYGWRRGHRPEFFGERNQTTVWELGHDTAAKDREHPTQKPIELFNRPIVNHTVPGQIVYEPFGGSGSQFIAAHRASRKCFGCELSPRFADVILKRAEAEGLTCERED